MLAFVTATHMWQVWENSRCTQVTRHNFEEVLPAVRTALEGCHYFSFDLEMTGLHVKESRSSFFEDIHDRYAQARFESLA